MLRNKFLLGIQEFIPKADTDVMTETKWCSRGKHFQSIEAFSKSSKSKDGLFTWCKTCMASYEKSRYHAGDRERKARNRKKLNLAAKEFLREYLLQHPCVDCKESDIVVLQFDHTDPSLKVSNIANMLRDNASISRIMREIEKCEVRCANCHIRRTAQQFDWWKSRV